jgi:hypothetical protein
LWVCRSWDDQEAGAWFYSGLVDSGCVDLLDDVFDSALLSQGSSHYV